MNLLSYEQLKIIAKSYLEIYKCQFNLHGQPLETIYDLIQANLVEKVEG